MYHRCYCGNAFFMERDNDTFKNVRTIPVTNKYNSFGKDHSVNLSDGSHFGDNGRYINLFDRFPIQEKGGIINTFKNRTLAN